jgi:hypothetical protein
LLSLALSLDEHAVGILSVIASHIRLHKMTALELRTMRSIGQVLGIVRRRLVVDVNVFAAEPVLQRSPSIDLLARAERRVVIEPQVLQLAAEEGRQLRKSISEEFAMRSAKLRRDAAIGAVSLDHEVDPHFAELPQHDAALHLERNGRTRKARHQESTVVLP